MSDPLTADAGSNEANRTDGESRKAAGVIQARTQSSPRIAYSVHGEGGPPVLLIMGLGMPGSVWRPQVEGLAHDHKVCHYDHLGLGESDDVAGFRTIATMADDALRVLDDLSWERAHVVGVSMGGMIGQELALTAPERCATLTLIATHAGGRGATVPTFRGTLIFTGISLFGHRGRVRWLPRLLYPDDYLQRLGENELRTMMADRLPKPVRPKTIYSHLTAALRHRTERRLHEIDCPTLLVRPGKDILIRPRQVDRLMKRIPGAELLRFDDAGHGVIHQKAEPLNAALRRHFQKASA